MAEIKAIAMVRDVTSGDDGLGIDYSLDIVDLSWKDQIETDDETYYYLFPNDGSVESWQLAEGLAQSAADLVNTLLAAAGQPQMAVCTFNDVFVPGFGDPKSAPRPQENIFTGYRERVRRIPRTLHSIALIPNAQELVLTANHDDDTLRCELQFLNAPDLDDQLEYRLFLHAPVPDLEDPDGIDDILLDQVIAGPPYRLWGQKAFASLHATLQSAAEIHGVLGLRRKGGGADVVPSQAGTISRASIGWLPRNWVRRFYLPASTAAAVSPAFAGEWDVTTGALRRQLNISNSGSGAQNHTVTDPAAQAGTNRDYLARQYVSAPLVAQTIAGTFRAQLRTNESDAAANARAQIIVRVVSNDGLTVRGTLYTGDLATLTNGDPTSEFTTTTANRTFPRGGGTLASLACLDGDRLVIEFGARFHNNTTTAYSALLQFGEGSGTRQELTEVEAAEAGALTPWIDFLPGVILA